MEDLTAQTRGLTHGRPYSSDEGLTHGRPYSSDEGLTHGRPYSSDEGTDSWKTLQLRRGD